MNYKPKVLGCFDHDSIYKRYLGGEKYDSLAKSFGVSPKIIKRIIDGMKGA